MNSNLFSASFVAAPLAIAACGGARPPEARGVETPPAPVLSPPQKAIAEVSMSSVGLDRDALDRDVLPCNDFYQFACGGWIAKTEIPSDESRWMRSFNVINEANEKELRRILDEAREKPGEGALRKLGEFYGACMDEEAIEKKGLDPVRPLLDLIGKVRDAASLGRAVTELHRHRVFALFDIDNAQDFKDATKMIAYLDQNGLGLPDRDDYETGDQATDAKKPEERTEDEKKQLEKSKTNRDGYVLHVERMLKLSGLSTKDAVRGAKDVLRIETELAKVSRTRVERRDPDKLYNRLDRGGVAKALPKLDWKLYFEGLAHPNIAEINVTAPKFLEGVNALFEKEQPAAWRGYLRWHVLRAAAPALTKAFVDESFTLRKLLTGQPELQPRWKRCVEATDDALGEILAQPYVEKKFAGDSKTAAERMVHEISRAFGAELERYEWMDEKTRGRAKEKLAAMAYLIGYPDRWKTYDYPLDPKSHGANVLASSKHELFRNLAKIGKPVDRKEWFMSPPTVNAYYHPNLNHMVFPAGILQPPFYSVNASVAVNLGGMGMVVGHELTHGFDDEGSKFDQSGNLAKWWEPGVREKFDAKTKCVEEQYSSYEALPGLKLNGELTLGENIADVGGIKLAFTAYRAMRADAPETLVADGFREDQLFFLGTAQVWCGKYREEIARLRARTDPHSSPQWRVNGPLSNLPEFARAFECAAGAPMVRAERCEVW